VLGASGPAGTGALAPCEVCARPPAFFVYTVSAGQAVSVLSGDLVLVPEHSLEDVDSVSKPEPDVVVIPAAAGPAGGELAPLRDWIARHAGRGAHILGECAGSVPLAAAAILVSPRAQRLVGHLAGAPPRPPRPIAEPPVKSFRPSSDGMPLAADAQNTGRRTAP
jgi:putative intracellular protease/amidase